MGSESSVADEGGSLIGRTRLADSEIGVGMRMWCDLLKSENHGATMTATNVQAKLPHRGSRSHRKQVLVLLMVSLVVVPLLALGTALAWTLHVDSIVTERESASRMRMIMGSLAAGVADRASADDWSGLQALIESAASEHGLERCAVVLPSGFVLADSARGVAGSPFEGAWGGAANVDLALALVAAEWVGTSSAAVATEVVRFDGRGEGVIVAVGSKVAVSMWDRGVVVGATACVMAACVLVMALAAHGFRSLRPLYAVQNALMWIANGEDAADALRINRRWGSEAEAWNKLVADLKRSSESAVASASEPIGDEDSKGGVLGTALDALAMGVMVLESDGTVLYSNSACAALLRMASGSLVGRPFENWPSDAALPSLLAQVSGEQGRRRASVEQTDTQMGEKNVLRMTAARVTGASGSMITVLIEDVSQQRLADASRDAFLAQATHELRTPLTNIRLYVETLLEEPEPDAKARQNAVNVMNHEVRRLERMVADMLSVAEIEAGSLKLRVDDVRLDAMFDELERDYRAAAAEKRIALRFDLSPKMPVIQGDRDRLALSLHNLIGNAIKYTPEDGSVVVKADSDGSTVHVSVTDTGIGIGGDEHELIFDRFYRARDPRVADIPGTGLGLALAREVVRLHGGELTVESEPNQGSTFTMLLPIRAQAA